MFAMSDRVRPCGARCRSSSEGRSTVTVPFSTLTSMSGCSLRESSPLGPFTVIAGPFTVTVTPLGTGTGFFPIRDIVLGSLPDEGEELATGVRAPRLGIGHEPTRRAENRHPETVPHARNVADADVPAKPGARNPLELPDDRLSALRVLQHHAPHGAPVLRLQPPVVLNEVFLLQDAGDLGLHLRYRHVHAAMLRPARIADPREHIGDRIGHAHVVIPCSLSYPPARPRPRDV